MYRVIDRLVEALSLVGGINVLVTKLGAKKPSGGNDLPAIAISLLLETANGAALNRFARSGDSVTRSRSVLDVKASSDSFSTNLKSLRIMPLPLKRNPASTKREFSQEDLQIHNVTDLANPISYRMVAAPTGRDEFKVDVVRAQIEFGAAQQEGEQLELTHWTMIWRDEIRLDRFIGSLTMDAWAASFDQTDAIVRKLQEVLRTEGALLREKGFLKLQPFSLGTAEHLRLDPPLGSAIPVWKQRLEYKFVFEAEDGGDLSSGIPIKQINVETGNHIDETFSIR
jgi:hypothetical protein